ncbi:MAG: hypothetical protein IT428_09815 [Planctomycetaceae bacterium]|nr:hypothetical protein [Planctomycetaceae bacterium]
MSSSDAPATKADVRRLIETVDRAAALIERSVQSTNRSTAEMRLKRLERHLSFPR